MELEFVASVPSNLDEINDMAQISWPETKPNHRVGNSPEKHYQRCAICRLIIAEPQLGFFILLSQIHNIDHQYLHRKEGRTWSFQPELIGVVPGLHWCLRGQDGRTMDLNRHAWVASQLLDHAGKILCREITDMFVIVA